MDDTVRGAGSPRLAVETWESLFRAQVALMRRLQADPVWDELTMREYDVLFSLTKGPVAGMRLRDLNALILLSQPSLSRMVERLERRGLVTRTTDPDDARGTLVRLTEAGGDVQRRIGRAHARAIATYVGGALDDDDLAVLGDLLERLRATQAAIPPVAARRTDRPGGVARNTAPEPAPRPAAPGPPA
ncbi:MarR family winged helix-turn-helix transcriptional regulator [Cellulosimicrobium marinum]|uniref:MarR family winged helix-turn-helix transcriptional regulator n=1 Tax=Cellulosimicrobium marinum TaxID=1638992 RepID=UPI001E6101C1|nr:MarR family winged helix-turn-helix transcriptional regulator [Cellulosimicrobium marinum]MCB7137120.1 MarR family winged helix-turn-helix transcriptional regulator [Cellulosimicrobium marinum]